MRFYRDLLGWTFERHETAMTPGGSYYIAKTGDVEVGGLMTAGPEQQDLPLWTVFFNVADVDEAVAAIAQAGGAVLEPPFDIPDARIAVVADPTRGMFALSSGLQPSGAWLSDTSGAVCWVELLTRDPATAESFYATVFGWKADTLDHGGTRYTTFTVDGELVAGGMMMPDEVPPEAPGAFWSVYFAVPDCEAAEQRVAAARVGPFGESGPCRPPTLRGCTPPASPTSSPATSGGPRGGARGAPRRARRPHACVPAGGRLKGALLRAGVVDEVDVELLPAVIGGRGTPALFDAPPLGPSERPVRLTLLHSEIADDGHVRLRYTVQPD